MHNRIEARKATHSSLLSMITRSMTQHKVRKRRSTPSILQISIVINFVLLWTVLHLVANIPKNELTETMSVWHGGHPAEDKSGSCWCSEDKYCMCTPNLAIDVVITSSAESSQENTNQDYVWLVRRKDTNQLGTMGGFVDVGETTENAVKRELMEEMQLKLEHPPKLIGMYSDPRRDNRRHTASAVYVVHVAEDIKPIAGDDAKEIVKIPIDEIDNEDFFADHRTILLDYRSTLRKEVVEESSAENDFPDNVQRSTCGIIKTAS